MALLMLPLAGVFGLWFAPILAAGPVWLVGIGVRFLRTKSEAWTLARMTHLFVGPAVIILGVYGLFAANWGPRSAAEGGGPFTTFGIYPLTLALGLGALSAVTLVLSWREGRAERS
jgi:hypothetical protein